MKVTFEVDFDHDVWIRQRIAEHGSASSDDLVKLITETVDTWMRDADYAVHVTSVEV